MLKKLGYLGVILTCVSELAVARLTWTVNAISYINFEFFLPVAFFWLEAVAKAVTNACSLRDIDQIRRPDREAVRDR